MRLQYFRSNIVIYLGIILISQEVEVLIPDLTRPVLKRFFDCGREPSLALQN
jgi:hypothetical protein